jgi:hypothetical protein
MVFEAKQVRVGQNAPLSVQKESVYSITGLHLLHVIRCHGMEKARAIFSREPNPSATRKIEQRRAACQRFVSGRGTVSHRVTIIG